MGNHWSPLIPDEQPAQTKSLAELGQIMLTTYGTAYVAEQYETTDPGLVGRLALIYGDINHDGSLN
jgi:hypothetical protein